MDNYRLHLRITTLGSPSNGQPHAGGPGSGDVIVDQEIDLRQWVAERGGLAEVAAANSAVETEPTQPVGPNDEPATSVNPLRGQPVGPTMDPMRAAVATPGTPLGPSPINAPASKPLLAAPVNASPRTSTAVEDEDEGRSPFDPSL